MPGTLFVVATPIGNLEDITLRALRVLKEVDAIAAEDTRRTARLLAHYGIATPTLSFHEHNSRVRVPQLVTRLLGGASLALVSDAGTPGIADPGVALVRACWQHAIPVDSIPGACAPVAAAVASGFPLDPLVVHGFAPARAGSRSRWFEKLRALAGTQVFLESPHRIGRLLDELSRNFGDRPILVARELTKVHQQILRGAPEDIVGHLTELRGEFTIVIGPRDDDSAEDRPVSDAVIYSEFRQLTGLGGGRRAAVTALADKYGHSAKFIYSVIEREKD